MRISKLKIFMLVVVIFAVFCAVLAAGRKEKKNDFVMKEVAPVIGPIKT